MVAAVAHHSPLGALPRVGHRRDVPPRAHAHPGAVARRVHPAGHGHDAVLPELGARLAGRGLRRGQRIHLAPPAHVVDVRPGPVLRLGHRPVHLVGPGRSSHRPDRRAGRRVAPHPQNCRPTAHRGDHRVVRLRLALRLLWHARQLLLHVVTRVGAIPGRRISPVRLAHLAAAPRGRSLRPRGPRAAGVHRHVHRGFHRLPGSAVPAAAGRRGAHHHRRGRPCVRRPCVPAGAVARAHRLPAVPVALASAHHPDAPPRLRHPALVAGRRGRRGLPGARGSDAPLCGRTPTAAPQTAYQG